MVSIPDQGLLVVVGRDVLVLLRVMESLFLLLVGSHEVVSGYSEIDETLLVLGLLVLLHLGRLLNGHASKQTIIIIMLTW